MPGVGAGALRQEERHPVEVHRLLHRPEATNLVGEEEHYESPLAQRSDGAHGRRPPPPQTCPQPVGGWVARACRPTWPFSSPQAASRGTVPGSASRATGRSLRGTGVVLGGLTVEKRVVGQVGAEGCLELSTRSPVVMRKRSPRPSGVIRGSPRRRRRRRSSVDPRRWSRAPLCLRYGLAWHALTVWCIGGGRLELRRLWDRHARQPTDSAATVSLLARGGIRFSAG